MTDFPRFADITTMRVGGPIARFLQPTSRVGFIEAVEDADTAGVPLCVIGGGSNLIASDELFEGVVVRDGRTDMNVLDQAAPREGSETTVHVNAVAGANWDDFVAFCLHLGLQGVEGLSGIPGTVGASVVQNIGAYGQEVSTVVDSVEVWDRRDKKTGTLSPQDLGFGYRTSALKTTMYDRPGHPAAEYFPTPRYVVLSVTFVLHHRASAPVEFGQLAAALGVAVGDSMDTPAIRAAVLAVRARKGMLEDPTRYENPWMAGRRHVVPEATEPDHDRWSSGSFFINPVLDEATAAHLPPDATRFAAGAGLVKTSSAWLIDQAGFHKGYPLGERPDAPASLSTKHTLALTNRGTATAADIFALAHEIQVGVQKRFGIALVPESVLVGFETDVRQR